jgi:hypothetical protein
MVQYICAVVACACCVIWLTYEAHLSIKFYKAYLGKTLTRDVIPVGSRAAALIPAGEPPLPSVVSLHCPIGRSSPAGGLPLGGQPRLATPVARPPCALHIARRPLLCSAPACASADSLASPHQSRGHLCSAHRATPAALLSARQ